MALMVCDNYCVSKYAGKQKSSVLIKTINLDLGGWGKEMVCRGGNNILCNQVRSTPAKENRIVNRSYAENMKNRISFNCPVSVWIISPETDRKRPRQSGTPLFLKEQLCPILLQPFKHFRLYCMNMQSPSTIRYANISVWFAYILMSPHLKMKVS